MKGFVFKQNNMAVIPKNKPQNLTQALFDQRVSKYNIDRANHPIVILGLRDYYDDAVGGSQNDRNFYDDAGAMSIYFKDGRKALFVFNWNTDPSLFRPATAKQKGIATLQTGVYHAHKIDWHGGKYVALCQRAAIVSVLRDGGLTDKGYLGINIHSGGNNGTYSEGCQTSPPLQFVELMTAVFAYFDIDYAKLFVNPFKPTQAERKAFNDMLVRNRELSSLIVPYVIENFKQVTV
jgi:lysozyme